METKQVNQEKPLNFMEKQALKLLIKRTERKLKQKQPKKENLLFALKQLGDEYTYEDDDGNPLILETLEESELSALYSNVINDIKSQL